MVVESGGVLCANFKNVAAVFDLNWMGNLLLCKPTLFFCVVSFSVAAPRYPKRQGWRSFDATTTTEAVCCRLLCHYPGQCKFECECEGQMRMPNANAKCQMPNANAKMPNAKVPSPNRVTKLAGFCRLRAPKWPGTAGNQTVGYISTIT